MLKVLVVEDEELIRKGIVLTVDWAELDCSVVGEASNGEEGLKEAYRCKPDLIITDLKMPKMDGLEMVRQLRENGNNAYVIILTAYDSFTYAQSAIRLGAVDFLLKPFHDGDLENAVLRLQKRVEAKNNVPQKDDIVVLGISKSDKSKYVSEAMDYIRDNYNNSELTIGEMARHMEISEGHLIHLFKRETGCTLLNYLTQYRTEKAKILLSDYKAKVYEVADMVGYKDNAYFSSTFKKIVGVTPSEYQNKKAEI